jgi:hypothetical protein
MPVLKMHQHSCPIGKPISEPISKLISNLISNPMITKSRSVNINAKSNSASAFMKEKADSFTSFLTELPNLIALIPQCVTQNKARFFLIQLVADYILTHHIVIANDLEWDMPQEWNVPEQSMVLTEIVDRTLNDTEQNLNNTLKVVNEVTKEYLLTRNEKTNRLDIPQKMLDESSTYLSELERTDEWSKLIDELEAIFGGQVSQTVITRNELVECVFFAAWDYYFQIIKTHTSEDVDLNHPQKFKSNLTVNKSKLAVRPVLNNNNRHQIEDMIILHVNKFYSELLCVGIQAFQMYHSDMKVGSNRSAIVNSIHSQIVAIDENLRK